MASSLFNQMNPTATQPSSNPLQTQLQAVKQMADTLRGASNPMSLLQTAAQQNPQLAQVMNMANGSGMSYKQLFSMAAQQRGIDPNQITSMLK